MSRMLDVIDAFIRSGERLMLRVPDQGFVRGTVESLDDDLVTIAPEGRPKIVLHYSAFAVLRD